jgi:hypothetical protein
MSRPLTPLVLLDLPAVAGRATLRAGLMAMQCMPKNLPLDRSGRYAALQKISSRTDVFCVIDISNLPAAGSDNFGFIFRCLPRAQRPRIILTRLAAGHVSAADRTWAKALGFADLLPEFDARDPEGGLRVALDTLARGLNLPPLAPADLALYVRAAAISVEPGAPRALIRALTGLSAERLTGLLAAKLDIADRSYHLKKYDHCFVGGEAVARIARRFKLPLAQALAIGRALGALGLLHHVEHKHEFANGNLFFRLAHSAAADAVDLGQAMAVLQGNVSIADRVHLGTSYRGCWVGADAVDLLCARYALARHEAHLVLQRIMQFGLFEHVADRQSFIDGNFFYRFNTLWPGVAERASAQLVA